MSYSKMYKAAPTMLENVCRNMPATVFVTEPVTKIVAVPKTATRPIRLEFSEFWNRVQLVPGTEPGKSLEKPQKQESPAISTGLTRRSVH
jgi:hypothetical protein